MMTEVQFNEFNVFAFAKAAVKSNPELLTALMQGAVAGQKAALDDAKEHLSWANLATDMALHMAMGKRVTAGTKEIAERVLRKRLSTMKNLNGIELEFLNLGKSE